MQEKNKKEKSVPKQNRERLSLYGQNPEKTIRAFMQVPIKRVIKREQDQKDKRN
jgi:hypothetical protein